MNRPDGLCPQGSSPQGPYPKGSARAALLVALLLYVWLPPPARGSDDPSTAAAKRLADAADPAARAAAIRHLAALSDEPAYRRVVAALSDPHAYVRRAAAGVLGVSVATGVKGRLLKEGPTWRDPVAREEVARVYSLWMDADGRTGLLRLLGDREAPVRAASAGWLGDDGDMAAGEALVRATADPDAGVRAVAFDAIAARQRIKGAAPVVVAFSPGLRDRDPRVRLSALEGSVAAASPGEGHEAAVFAVLHGLDDAVWSVRLAAAELAGTLRDRRMLEPLVLAVRDPRDRVAQSAGSALVRLTGIPFDADPERWGAWLKGDGAAFDPSSVDSPKAAPFDPGGKTVAAVKFLDLPVASAHVTFVLDASGSMREVDAKGTSRWDRVREEMDRVLLALGTSAEGNVVLFSDAATTLFPQAVRFSPEVRAKVKSTLSSRVPAGRTALYDGIALALLDPSVDTVVVLSDGAPSAGRYFTKTDLRLEVARADRWRKARIDVVSIGGDEAGKRWRTLLKSIAEDHGGRFVSR